MLIDEEYLEQLHSVLNKISTALPMGANVTCAGGAIRDMLLEKEIKDIDIFIDEDIISIHKLKIWFPKVDVCEHGGYEDSSFNVLYNITTKEFPVPIQIIQVECVEEHIEKFPTCLSRVYYNRKEGLQNLTPQFLKDAFYKRLTFDMPVNHQYLDKMKMKFPNWWVMFTKPEYNPTHLHELEF